MPNDQVLTHVEVVYSCNQTDHSTNIQRCFPMVAHIERLHQEEHSRGDHRDRDDPEGDGNDVVGIQESVVICHACNRQILESKTS
jgi:hypothetical protein